MINESTGWLGAYGPNIAFTTTGGVLWQPVNKPSGNEEITELKFFDNTGIGFMVLGNKLYKTWNNGIITSLTHSGNNIPDKFSLMQNYPNPFNPATNIKFDIPLLSNVKVTIYDITGKEISVLVNRKLLPKSYSYTFYGSNFASGIYFYSIKAGDPSDNQHHIVQTRRMMLIK